MSIERFHFGILGMMYFPQMEEYFLFRKVCELKVEFERRSSVIQHNIKTVKHAKMIKRREIFKTRTRQMITQTNTSKKSTFNMDLL